MSSVIGVVTGLKFEADILRAATRQKGTEAPLVVSVSGDQNHAYRTAHSLAKQGAKGLVSFGIAGGLSEAAPVGALFLPQTIVSEDGTVYPTDSAWRTRLCRILSPHVAHQEASLVSLPYGLEDERKKRAWYDQTGAYAVDMESYGLARGAAEARLPCLVIRVISDSVYDRLPASVISAMGKGGTIDLGVIMREASKNPVEFLHLIRFAIKTIKATKTLRRVSLLALPRFGL